MMNDYQVVTLISSGGGYQLLACQRGNFSNRDIRKFVNQSKVHGDVIRAKPILWNILRDNHSTVMTDLENH